MVLLARQSRSLDGDPFIPRTIHLAGGETCPAPATRPAYGERATTTSPKRVHAWDRNRTTSDPVSQSLDTASDATAACRILVVEDEGIVALDLISTLRQMGYVVTAHAVSGDEAIHYAESTLPDLILMDIRLRGAMDGIEAARHIRACREGIPIVFVTAFRDENTLQRARAVGGAGFLPKPFSRSLLEEAITQALRELED